jgi:hypothetical protein
MLFKKTHFGGSSIFKPKKTDVVVKGFPGKPGYFSCREETILFAR